MIAQFFYSLIVSHGTQILNLWSVYLKKKPHSKHAFKTSNVVSKRPKMSSFSLIYLRDDDSTFCCWPLISLQLNQRKNYLKSAQMIWFFLRFSSKSSRGQNTWLIADRNYLQNIAHKWEDKNEKKYIYKRMFVDNTHSACDFLFGFFFFLFYLFELLIYIHIFFFKWNEVKKKNMVLSENYYSRFFFQKCIQFANFCF